jgi:cytochrome c2
MMHPLPVWLLFCGAFALWHLPKPHQDALENEAVHALEHASFLLTALMFWSIVIEPSGRRRLGYGATLVLVVTTAALSGMPGALLALAPRPLYSAYAAGAAAWGMTPMEDQQLAGLVMWVPAGFAYVAAAAVLFVKWLAAAERDMRRSGRSAVLRSLAVLLVPLILAACDVGTKATAQAVGQAAHGAALIRQYGCGSCHVVPGIDGADGLVGPPLLQIGRRIYVAGVLRNTPDNLVAWLQNPQRFVPGNAMPDMGMGEADARDVAAYLYTLR